VRQENRVEVDVGAAQVEQVGDIVQRRNQVAVGAGLLHGGAQIGQLAAAAFRGVGRQVFINRRVRQGWAVLPDLVQQVEIGAQFDVFGVQRGLQQAGDGQAEHGAIHGQRLAGFQMACQPVNILHAGAGGQLH
jgi:hypothetical protein